MNKNIETSPSRTETTNTDAIESIETVELDNVTGGCAACGCSSPTTAPAAGGVVGSLFAGTWRR